WTDPSVVPIRKAPFSNRTPSTLVPSRISTPHVLAPAANALSSMYLLTPIPPGCSPRVRTAPSGLERSSFCILGRSQDERGTPSPERLATDSIARYSPQTL